MTNWPSAPMFQTLERKAHRQAQRDQDSSGVALTDSSDSAYPLHRLDEEHLQAAQRVLAERANSSTPTTTVIASASSGEGQIDIIPRRLGRGSSRLMGRPRGRPQAAHPFADALDRGLGDGTERRHAPLAITISRSLISNSSSSSSLTTSSAQPASRSEQLAADLRRGAHVHAPGGLADDQQPGGGVDLAPTMNFCRLPPDRLLRRRPGRRP